jgi:hypothetical protein
MNIVSSMSYMVSLLLNKKKRKRKIISKNDYIIFNETNEEVLLSSLSVSCKRDSNAPLLTIRCDKQPNIMLMVMIIVMYIVYINNYCL